MSYIAFIDMVGTRASATISNQEYIKAINSFTNSLKRGSSICQCTIYGYSDNAYIQIENLTDLIKFFRFLRENLIYEHRYFSAAVDCGSLNADRVSFDNRKSLSMKFTAPATVDIYRQQCQFSGIGVSLSQKVVDDLVEQKMQDAFCMSIYKDRPNINGDSNVTPIYDLSYEPVIFEKIKYIMSDYLLTVATNERAGRYYITPIISMIKCLDKNTLLNDLDKTISLLSFQVIPEAFQLFDHNREYSLFFMFALIEFTLSLREKDQSIDAKKICEQIIEGYNIDYSILVKTLPSIPAAIISNENKRKFLSILYNMKRADN